MFFASQGDIHVVDDFALSDDLEAAAQEVYTAANRRSTERLRLQAESGSGGIEEDDLVHRLGMTTLDADDDGADANVSALTTAIAREKEQSEELLDLIGGGKSAQAASVAYRAAEYLRRLVSSREWGPSVLFITE